MFTGPRLNEQKISRLTRIRHHVWLQHFLKVFVKDVSGELLDTGFHFDTIPLRLPVAEVNSIPVGTHYIGPSPTNATPCQCSTVTYSLVSACGGCQERNFLSWTDWAANCREGIILFILFILRFSDIRAVEVGR
jgi:hypothetical protein